MKSSLIEFGILEMPGQLNILEPTYDTARMFANCGALVYVLDSQTEYLGAIQNLIDIVSIAIKENPSIIVEVLIHKIDGLSDDYSVDTQRDIIQRANDELVDNNMDHLVQMSFHATSIYDKSIHEAFSRIVQKLIPETPTLENMLNLLVQHSCVEKAFLCDLNSKIYIATDSSPVDPLTYEACMDFIDVTLDLDMLYGEPHDFSPQPPDFTDSTATDPANPPPYGRARITSASKMNDGITIYLSQMIRGLGLLCFIRSQTQNQVLLLEYNADIFLRGLQTIWKNHK